MTIPHARLALVPVLGLSIVAALAQTLYAGSSNSPCFSPTLDIYTLSSPGSTVTAGTATIKLTFKPPFIIEGAATAEGFLDQDSGAAGGLGASGVSRFWTPQCAGWSYGWGAEGAVTGSIKSKAAKSQNGSASAACSFAVVAAGDINPSARDSKTVSNATSGGSSMTLNVGVTPTGPSVGVGLTTTSQTVQPSTNSAGDANALLDGPKTNYGCGAETVVSVSLYEYHNAAANGRVSGSVAHVRRSDSSTGGFAGAAIVQSLWAAGPSGLTVFAMDVHPQSGCYRHVFRDRTTIFHKGPWLPPIGPEYEEGGPEERKVTEPPAQPVR